jgi:hypothetical protein
MQHLTHAHIYRISSHTHASASDSDTMTDSIRDKIAQTHVSHLATADGGTTRTNDRQTDRRMHLDRQTSILYDGMTDRQTDRQSSIADRDGTVTDRQTDRQHQTDTITAAYILWSDSDRHVTDATDRRHACDRVG